jgi:hypothetical protein
MSPVIIPEKADEIKERKEEESARREMRIKVPVARKESIEKVLEEIFYTIDSHNNEVRLTKSEAKNIFCFQWNMPVFILLGIAPILVPLSNTPLYMHNGKTLFSIWAVSIFIAYLITEKKYCKPYYQVKDEIASKHSSQIADFEMELSDLIKHTVQLHGCILLRDEYVYIGDGNMHQDDYYSELYGGRWTKFAIDINGKSCSFNPYEDITYT